MRVISKGGIAPHDIIGVKARGPYSQAALEIIFCREHDSADMPVVAKDIQEVCHRDLSDAAP